MSTAKSSKLKLRVLTKEDLVSTVQQSVRQNNHTVAATQDATTFKRERALGRTQISESLVEMRKL